MMKKPKVEYAYPKDIKGYQDAVWDFMLEHAKITKSGNLKIYIETVHRKNFENRILSRWEYGYHGKDPKKLEAKIKKKESDWNSKKPIKPKKKRTFVQWLKKYLYDIRHK